MCLSLLDFNVHFHKICGYLILIYASIHSISHLAFSLPGLSDPNNQELIKENVSNWQFTGETPSYGRLLTQTIPGVTGMILWSTIITMWVTALEYVRRRKFQIFAYVHMTLFPVFIVGMCVHGGARWVNFLQFPLGLMFLPLPFFIYFFMVFRRMINM